MYFPVQFDTDKPKRSLIALKVNFNNTYTRNQLSLATVVEGDSKAPFSIAATPSWRGERYSIHWFASIYPWSVSYNGEC